MRSALLAFLFFSFWTGTSLSAQPANDNCQGAVDLGALPACNPGVLYTNVNATNSNIGAGNSPSCFNGGTTQRDVWFSFSTTPEITDVSIIVSGVSNGPNARAIGNPQIALYRGDCTPNGFSEIACASAPNGEAQVTLNFIGLATDTRYFVRVNDYSPSASPNWGDFTICVDEVAPVFRMGEFRSTSACFGTLYDTGGPDGAYRNNENLSFNICPSLPHQCIEIEVVNYNIELFSEFLGGDVLNFYAGESTSAPLIATLSGPGTAAPFKIQTSGECITVEFVSDDLITLPGFELRWSCSPEACDGSGFDNPTEITSLPYNRSGLTTCGAAATFNSSPCVSDAFLNGEEYVFVYDSPGNTCLEIEVTGAESNTGIIVLDGLPDDPETNCITQTSRGVLRTVDVRDPGTYYIVIANGSQCTDFNISVRETDCALSPSLEDALGNPLNGCAEEGLPSIFLFEDGFQDIPIIPLLNGGCWLGVGAEPDFYWFTVQASIAGQFGFILASADNPSDIDFNVWGPFSQQQVAERPQEVINYIRRNAPIRSSWYFEPGPTGVVNIHPETGDPVTDPYDCGVIPGAEGDGYVTTIPAGQGDVFVILVNDWGDEIVNGGILVDWSPSTPGLLDPIPVEIVMGADTAICAGDSVQIQIESAVTNIQWLNDTETLSCSDCLNPVAKPVRSTVYRAAIEGVCIKDTIEVNIDVFSVDAGPDRTVCRGETFEIIAGEDFDNATYAWTASQGVTLSCTDCPNPTVTAPTAGTFQISVTLTGEGCTLNDAMTLTVLNFNAPQFTISEDVEICEGVDVSLGGPPSAGVTYSWASNPAGFSSSESNPQVSPAATTTYILSATNAECPVPSIDSVIVTVFREPVLNVAEDTTVCLGDTLTLGITIVERDVDYSWTGPNDILDATNPNTRAVPRNSGTYTLTAKRGACEVTGSFMVEVNPLEISIVNGDTTRFCTEGAELILEATINPSTLNVTPVWTASGDPDVGTVNALTLPVSPRDTAIYFVTATFENCVRFDSILVVVDSLPADLAISPGDTSICEGQFVLLTTLTYEPTDYPDITFLWEPSVGQQTPDSLLNMVVTPDTTTTYMRITTNGSCIDTAMAMVEVKPIAEIRILPADTLICVGESFDYEVEAPGPLEMIMWMPEAGLSCVDCENPRATPPATVTYNLSAMYEGCPVAASARVVVNQGPRFALTAKRVICFGESIQLNSVSDPNTTYTWTSTDPNFGVSNDPTPVVSPTQTATYFLNADNGICDPVMVELTIEVIQQATVALNVSDDRVCSGDPVTITAVVTGGSSADQFNWVDSRGNQFTGRELRVFPRQTNTYTLTYLSGGNCQTIIRSATVVVDPGVTVTIVPDPPGTTVPQGAEVILNAEIDTDSPGPLTIGWTEDGRPISGGEAVQVRVIQDGVVYIVEVVTPAGCVGRDSIVFDVTEPNIQIPNAFTPDGDQKNDFFNVLYSGNIDEVVRFQVFNRWGKLVYDNDNPNQGWDGTYNGEPQPSDVYVYIVTVRKLDGSETTLKGDVTLIR